MEQIATRRQKSDDWIDHLFSAKAVQKGGVVRRSVDWVTREVGTEKLELEVRRRHFRMVRAGGQFIIICSQDPVQIIC